MEKLFCVEVNDNGQYNFNDSEYGIYNAHGNFKREQAINVSLKIIREMI